jgi:hypothetical protein
LTALAWTPSRVTSAWLTTRSLGLPAVLRTVVEARVPEPAWRETRCSHAEADAESTVGPATSLSPTTAALGATFAALALPAQHRASAAVSAATAQRLA